MSHTYKLKSSPPQADFGHDIVTTLEKQTTTSKFLNTGCAYLNEKCPNGLRSLNFQYPVGDVV